MSNISDKIAVKAACTCTSSSASSHTLPYPADGDTPPATHSYHASHTWPPGYTECRGRKCQSARSPQPRTWACECAFLFKYVLFALVIHHLKGEFAYRRQTAILFLPLILLVVYIFYYFGAF